ncbi:MarR family winged helix-turn-helix transcriptional regulator [Tautonia sociabilis]|uniref:MarR family winged helix-turn-helix transcriptional regulator n=1 Tax=Tautonia sociabilis TaxID=2080755 RepID=UPI0013159D7E|nr:MarR family transcriptional regulator [Tautonia sociabilis]
MLHYDFEQSLIYRVCSASQALEKALNDELAPLGITHRQWQVLGWLALEGRLSQSELADRMRIEPPTLAGIVDRMERDGWLERSPCPGDRRRKLLSPTERVAPVWEAIASAARRVRARASQGFSEAELLLLFAALERIRKNITSPAPASSSASASASAPSPSSCPSSSSASSASSPTPPTPSPALAEDRRR